MWVFIKIIKYNKKKVDYYAKINENLQTMLLLKQVTIQQQTFGSLSLLAKIILLVYFHKSTIIILLQIIRHIFRIKLHFKIRNHSTNSINNFSFLN